MSESNVCGSYFPVTDQVNKPLVMLDSTRRITGVGEYEPFGQVNRVSVDLETAHPYPVQTGGTVATLISTSGGSTVFDAKTIGSLKVDYRAKFQSVDVRQFIGGSHNYCSTAPITDGFNLVDDTSGVGITTSFIGNHAGTLWTPWGTPASGKAHAALTYGYYSVHYPFFNSPGCLANNGPAATFFGAVVEGYEYRRYDGAHGASPFWTPLRFAGQYHDEETDLNENHHRYYEPLTGRYLEPEPKFSTSENYSLKNAIDGETVSAYGYADGNPTINIDPDGQAVTRIDSPLQCTEDPGCHRRVSCGGQPYVLSYCFKTNCTGGLCGPNNPLGNLVVKGPCHYKPKRRDDNVCPIEGPDDERIGAVATPFGVFIPPIGCTLTDW